MEPNFLALLVAALSTVVIGAIWYNPNVFGKVWMHESRLTEADLKSGNIIKIISLSIIFAFFMAFILQFMVIHQYGVFGLIGGDPSKALPSYANFMADYGTHYRTFKHGMLHGAMMGVLFALPLMGINGLFERKSWKYILINGGYFIVSLTIMGGIICAWE